jgi:hypothetical protein
VIEKGSTSFLKKRSKKLLLLGTRVNWAQFTRILIGKSLLVLFYKKERLPSPATHAKLLHPTGALS